MHSVIYPAFIISHWGLLEEEKDSVDYKITFREIVMDIMKGPFGLTQTGT